MSILPQEELRAMLSISQSMTKDAVGSAASSDSTLQLSSILSFSEELRELSKINRAIAQSLRSQSAAQREQGLHNQLVPTPAQRLISV